MPPGIHKTFNVNQYLHSSHRFSVIKEWFSHARFIKVASLRDYVLNPPEVKRLMPIEDNSGFQTELTSDGIPYILFVESQVFLNRALSNFCAQIDLHRQGHLSWAIVTTYYSNFFAMAGLVRLQGKARIATHDLSKLPRGVFVAISNIIPPRTVVFENWRNHHEQTYNDFYHAYRQFNFFRNFFDDLLSLNQDDLRDERRRRNDYNYGLDTGFKELDSPDYERPDLRKLSFRNVQSLPNRVTETDPEWAYMARACCRIILLGAISWHIAKESRTLRPVFDKFRADREKLVWNVCRKSKTMGNCLLRFTNGRMRLL